MFKNIFNHFNQQKAVREEADLNKAGLATAEYSTQAYGINFGWNNRGLVYAPTDEEGHVVVFGGSGLGKTSALLIPSVAMWSSSGTSLIIDIAGDIERVVSVHTSLEVMNRRWELSRQLIFKPGDPDTRYYDVFAEIDKMPDEEDRNVALEKLAYILMPIDIHANSTTQFFNDEGRKILTAALLAFYSIEPEAPLITGDFKYDFCDICKLIFSNDWKTLFQKIDEAGNVKASSYLNSFQGANEANTAGCKQAVDKAIQLFATNKKIQACVRRCKLLNDATPISTLTLETNNNLVCIADDDLPLYAPLLHLITAQALDYCSRRAPVAVQDHPILLAFDEFVSLGHLDIVDGLRKLRKKNVRLMVLTQSLADIDDVYGESARRVMMNNFRYTVVLGANDTDTQEYLAKMVGQHMVQRRSVTTDSNHHRSETVSDSKEFVIEPEKFRQLGDYLLLIHPGGFLKLRKNYYYKNYRSITK